MRAPIAHFEGLRYIPAPSGEVAEWFKVPAWKVGVR